MRVAVLRQVELAQDRADVRLDCLRREPEVLRDARVRPALGDEPEDLALARSEAVENVVFSPQEQLLHDFGIERRAPAATRSAASRNSPTSSTLSFSR